MKTLLIGWFDEEGIKKKFDIKDDELYIISDKARRMVYRKNKTQNVYYIDDINDLDEYKRVLGEIGMKFDKVIMNPPYEKNLHLKVIEEVMKHVDDDGEVVNLSPIRWLQDPLAKYKESSDYNTFEMTVSKYIDTVDVITASMAQQYFGDVVMNIDLGVYKIVKNINSTYYEDAFKNTIVQKIIPHLNNNHCCIDNNRYEGYRVKINTILGGKSGGGGKKRRAPKELSYGKLIWFKDGERDGKPWYDYYTKNQYSKTTKEITNSIKFNSEQEAQNFIDQFSTKFHRYITQYLITDVHVSDKNILWMQDYTQPWTNERFYKYFNITEEEQKIIEETMAQYES